VHQLHYRPQRPVYFSIISKFPNHIHQIDLMDVSDIASSNSGTKFLLCEIDIFTRKAYVHPLKSKTMASIIEAIKTILSKVKPMIICSDSGSEFINWQFRALCKRNNIETNYFTNDKHKLGTVERFNQTIRAMINKYLTANHITRYIHVLDKLVENYNNSQLEGIIGTPDHPGLQKIHDIIVQRYHVGDCQKCHQQKHL